MPNNNAEKVLSKFNQDRNNWFIITTSCKAKQNEKVGVHVTKLTKANNRVLIITLVETRPR